jgi:hypothetical protein
MDNLSEDAGFGRVVRRSIAIRGDCRRFPAFGRFTEFYESAGGMSEEIDLWAAAAFATACMGSDSGQAIVFRHACEESRGGLQNARQIRNDRAHARQRLEMA